MAQTAEQAEDFTLRIYFTGSGFFPFIFSLKNLHLYYCSKNESPEYARLTNTALLCFIFSCVHLVAGLFTFKVKIDYWIFKPLVACVLWNSWVLLMMALHLGQVWAYDKESGSFASSLVLALVFVLLVILQTKLHWKLYKDLNNRRE